MNLLIALHRAKYFLDVLHILQISIILSNVFGQINKHRYNTVDTTDNGKYAFTNHIRQQYILVIFDCKYVRDDRTNNTKKHDR